MTVAFWLALAVVVLLQATTMKVAVAFAARGSDNGWDNAFAYVISTALLIYFPVKWMLLSGSLPLQILAAPLLFVGQTAALRVLYELRTYRAVMLGILHTVVATSLTFVLAAIAAVVAAYILYGKIISDPLRLIRIILELIGIELPMDGP